MESKKANKEIVRKLLHNKKNNQILLTLSRKELGLNKGQKPKRIKFKIKGFKW